MYCLYPWQESYIDVMGNVRCCCFMSPFLGNLKDYNSFLSLWNNENARGVRRAIVKNEIHPFCNHVSCPHYNKYPLYTQDYKFIEHQTIVHPYIFDGCIDRDKLLNFFDSTIKNMWCEHHSTTIFQTNYLLGIPGFQELYYTEELHRCNSCGYKYVKFLLHMDTVTTDVNLLPNTVCEYGKELADVYLPIINVGQGDVLNLLRFYYALNSIGLTLGLILPESYAIWEELLPELPVKHAFILRNNLGVSTSAYSQIKALIKEYNLQSKIPDIEITISYDEYLKFSPVMSSNSSYKTDILIHRRCASVDRVSTRNIEGDMFKNLISVLDKDYYIGVVGLLSEDNIEYKGDLRFLSFADQVRAVSNTQLVIDTDSLFDKVAEAVGVSSLTTYLEYYFSWGVHLGKNNDIVLCVPELSVVNKDIIIDRVNWFFNTYGK